MEKSTQEMILVGHYSFTSKDKSNTYYVVQALYSKNDLSNGNLRGTIINLYVSVDDYERVKELELGTVLKVEISSNIETGKLYYKLAI